MDYTLSDPLGEGLEFDHVILFVVGGGSYAEYEGVKAAMTACGQHLVYGCSSMVSPEQFLSQLQPRKWTQISSEQTSAVHDMQQEGKDSIL
jgi:hypothetical protein